MKRYRVHFVSDTYVDVIARDEFHARSSVKLQGYHAPVRMVERLECCEICGNDNATFAPDTFASEMNGDYRKRWLCPDCQSALADEI